MKGNAFNLLDLSIETSLASQFGLQKRSIEVGGEWRAMQIQAVFENHLIYIVEEEEKSHQ